METEVKPKNQIEKELVDEWSIYWKTNDGFKLLSAYLDQILCVMIDTREVIIDIKKGLKK